MPSVRPRADAHQFPQLSRAELTLDRAPRGAYRRQWRGQDQSARGRVAARSRAAACAAGRLAELAAQRRPGRLGRRRRVMSRQARWRSAPAVSRGRESESGRPHRAHRRQAGRARARSASMSQLVWLTPAMDGLFTGPASRPPALPRPAGAGHRSQDAHAASPATTGPCASATACSSCARARPLCSRGSRSRWPRPARPSPPPGSTPWRGLPALIERYGAARRRPLPVGRTRARRRARSGACAMRPRSRSRTNFAACLAEGRERDRAAAQGPRRTASERSHSDSRPQTSARRNCSTGEQKALLIGLDPGPGRADVQSSKAPPRCSSWTRWRPISTGPPRGAFWRNSAALAPRPG